MLGIVTEHLFDLIAKQIDERGLVVWYDPEQAYGAAAAELQLLKTTVARTTAASSNCGNRSITCSTTLAPGSVYAASVDDQGKVGLYRLEVGCSPGTGKLKIAGGIEGPMRESINRAFAYLQSQKGKMGIAQDVDTTDFHIEAIDLLSNRVPCEAGIALVVAAFSAVKRHSVQPGLMILGDLSIQGNIKSVKSLSEPLQVASGIQTPFQTPHSHFVAVVSFR